MSAFMPVQKPNPISIALFCTGDLEHASPCMAVHSPTSLASSAAHTAVSTLWACSIDWLTLRWCLIPSLLACRNFYLYHHLVPPPHPPFLISSLLPSLHYHSACLIVLAQPSIKTPALGEWPSPWWHLICCWRKAYTYPDLVARE